MEMRGVGEVCTGLPLVVARGSVLIAGIKGQQQQGSRHEDGAEEEQGPPSNLVDQHQAHNRSADLHQAQT